MGSVDISIEKAWTPRAFDIETKELAPLAQRGKDCFGIQAVRAIGVSGGSGTQDHEVAEAGAKVF